MPVARDPDTADHVVDASALAKLFLNEPESDAFRAWYLTEVQAGAKFAAPGLLAYEIAHLLGRNLKPPAPARAAEWLAERHDEVMTGVALDEGAARRSFPWIGTLTGYDASYLSTATATRASLVSYDEALLKAAARQGVKTHTPR